MIGTAWLVAQLALYNLGAWLLTYLIHSSALLGTAWAISRALRPAPAWEVWVWRSAIVGGIATATIRLAVGEVTGGAGLVEGAAELTGTFGVLGALVAMAWLILVPVRLRNWRRSRRRSLASIGARSPVGSTSLRAMSDEIARCLGLCSGPVRFTRAAGIRAPVAVGRAEVCLPEHGFEELDEPQRRSVLAHEIGHLAFRDPLWRTFGQLVRVALFLQPLNRPAIRRLREVGEFRADDVAVRMSGDRLPLMEALFAVAAQGRAGSELEGSIGFASLLERRVDRLDAGPSPGAVRIGPVRIAVTVLLLGLALTVPGIDPPCDCRIRAALAELRTAAPDAAAELVGAATN